ncbi:MAG TPA: hypothetical protein VF522_19060 [Ramlibacter sp.]|uniref:hypothetical protein n=1 Tax=Ramlibacter sp. TaxID=1917967 RepID=UPI002ED3A459
MSTISVGDAITINEPDRRWRVRLWCWLTRRPHPTRARVFRVTHVTTAGGWVSVR